MMFNNKFLLVENIVKDKLSKYDNRHMNDINSLEAYNLRLNRQNTRSIITDFRVPNETANEIRIQANITCREMLTGLIFVLAKHPEIQEEVRK